MEKDLGENGVHVAIQDDGFDEVGSIATNIADGFTMAAVGDLLYARPVTKGYHPGLDEVLTVLHGNDVVFGNLETNILDVQSKGCPQAEYGGAYLISVAEVGRDLSAMGFNMVSRANNHTLDWGVEGLRETSRALDENRIVHAGAGENLAQAGAARYLETPRGRAALVSFAATFEPMARACNPAGEAPGRPGLNALRLAKSVVVSADMLENLRQVREALPWYAPPPKDSSRVAIAEVVFKAGEKPGYSFEPNPRDVDNILRNVRQGKQFGDFCIATNHGHEPGGFSREPADYEQAFARKLIDAGADVYINHGPHHVRGIEIYKGRPIFYALGNFFNQDLRSPVGADMFDAHGKDPRIDTDAEVSAHEMAIGYPTAEGFIPLRDAEFYESVIGVSCFEDNQLAEIRLYPIELRRLNRFANRGVPRLAPAAQGHAILNRIQELSEAFGTKIEIDNGVGVIRLRSSSAKPLGAD
ncbi:CapA family protein [Mesorhizobium sp. M1A.F.Ca.ET.072.01.1.1]|uniref:CapA family protein n=1 Tax=Mesorhizobium sp. M1A.F.Ca.ET.072.01.1.1 TaxID=2496753 RepID=UPI000FD1DB94|nr:CapA family protein [Mesorhizobium sp. M1A.F.Ca.ET.072.01.1.1]RUW47263.1 CapA family protein [Mesorhizobium sp. M1A.F.Ca.ET.072.01.1.1]TIV02589.1 MAG: CapA family protein [Mesorhizobium sp.]